MYVQGYFEINFKIYVFKHILKFFKTACTEPLKSPFKKKVQRPFKYVLKKINKQKDIPPSTIIGMLNRPSLIATLTYDWWGWVAAREIGRGGQYDDCGAATQWMMTRVR